MAYVKFEVSFDNEEWKDLAISTNISDKLAYKIYRVIAPKKADFPKEETKTEQN